MTPGYMIAIKERAAGGTVVDMHDIEISQRTLTIHSKRKTTKYSVGI